MFSSDHKSESLIDESSSGDDRQENQKTEDESQENQVEHEGWKPINERTQAIQELN